jgi:hypothetical protein
LAAYWITPGMEQYSFDTLQGTFNTLKRQIEQVYQKKNPEYIHNYLNFVQAVKTYQKVYKDKTQEG